MLRLIAFKASDSPYVVCDPVPEYSAEGRMQLNPYTRGTSDRPRLVLLQGKVEDYLSSYKGDGYIGKGYGRDYSVEDETAEGAYKERIPVCTDDYQKEFDITGFVKKETQSADAAVEVDGYAIKFSNDGNLRYVAVSENGAINWFDPIQLREKYQTLIQQYSGPQILT